MNKKFKLLLGLLAVTTVMGVAAACDNNGNKNNGDGSSISQTTKYTVKFVNYDGTVLSEAEYEEGATVTAPTETPTKPDAEGYSYTFAGWDKEVAAATEDVTYTATFTPTPITYTITFKAGETTVATKTYTVETESVDAPAVSEIPEKTHYDATGWESFTLSGGNFEVQATYAPKTYTVTFKAGETTVATQNYTVETESVTAPAVSEIPDKDHYTATGWGAFDPKNGGNVEVQATYTPVIYYVTFYAEDGETEIKKVPFSIEDCEGKDSEIPEIPYKKGYTGSWEGEYNFAELKNQSVKASYVGATYTISYKANGGTLSGEATQSVAYGADFTFATTATAPKAYQEFLGWVDADGNKFTAGKWELENDVELTAVFSKGVAFDTLSEVPAYLTVDGGRMEAPTLVEMNGGKAFKAQVKTDCTGDAGLYLTTAFLGQLFEDENVAYVAFDVKTDTPTSGNNVYHRNAEDGAWTRYESGAYDTIHVDSFKTYYFPRAAYEGWVAKSLTSNRFLMLGNVVTKGASVFVDNIRPVTQAEKDAGLFSFEYGGVRTNNGNSPLYYNASSGSWEISISNVDSTTAGFTNTIVSDGNRAYTFTKLAGVDSAFNFNHTADTTMEITLKEAGYAAFDIYTSAESDGFIKWHGHTNRMAPLNKGGWTTVYAQLFDDSNEFFRIYDTTGSTYVIDNIRTITADEYNARALNFEVGQGSLRDELTMANNAAYYYFGNDNKLSVYDFAFGKGGGENDANAIANIHFDSAIKHSGEHSIAFNKGNGYMFVSMNTNSTVYALLKDGFTFWVYSTVEIDATGSQFVNGLSATTPFNGGAGMIIPANTWTQITVTAEDINEGGRFLIMQGNWEGTIYLDDFQPLPATDAE